MPFKLRLKRSRQYNVVSKSLFVITIELLDGCNIECTLSAESSGQECLDSVCQRLGLQQPEFFGLRYTWRHGGPGPPQLRWVELERPLKRQLDKNARGNVLLLRVMYYVSGVHLLHDEMTRYHYFLQLKTDLIDGRMHCDHKQAILLASYGMQAEFGNHDPERHTAEYLKDFNMFPKPLIDQNRSHLESMVEAVMRQHAALAGLAQGTAEEFYILAAQQLDGYGQEVFVAKDESGVEVMVGVSLTGILASYETSSKFFKWKDITNVINQKRHFGIECQLPFDNMQFVFPDPELAKYVWRMCVHQHTFYMQNENAPESAVQSGADQNQGIAFHSGEDGQLCESREELDVRELADWSAVGNPVQRAQSTSCLDISKSSEMDRLRALLPSYRPAPDYETAVQLKYHNSNVGNSNAAALAPRRAYGTYMYSSQPDIHRTQTQLMEVQKTLAPFAIYKDYPDVAADVKHQVVLTSQPMPSPAPAYSTPDLDAVDAGMHMLHLYSSPSRHVAPGPNLIPSSLPPPPYPVLRGASSSTPDLATQAMGLGEHSLIASTMAATAMSGGRPMLHGPLHVSGSSPDLVSSRGSCGARACIPTGLPPVPTPLTHNAAAHRTYTDLASATAAATNVDNSVLPPPEPIYENVPLPWATTSSTITTSCASTTAAANLHSRQPCESQETSSSVPVSTPVYTTVVPSTLSSPVSGGHTPPHVRTLPLAEHHQPPPLLPHQAQQQLQQSLQQAQQLQQLQQQQQQQQLQKQPSVGAGAAAAAAAAALGHVHLAVDRDMIEPASNSMDAGGKGKTKKRWVLRAGGKGKGKSNTLGKEKPVSDSAIGSSAEVTNRKHRWSTGLPRVPLSPTISKETMCRVLERKLADSQLFFEFEKIPKKKPNADFSTALHPENEKRNRYKDVLPYEENRVRLTPSRENKFGYINASHITATVGSHQRFYIAAQGPLPLTVHSFWQMVWEADVYLVVMLCGLHDDGTASYCPPNGDRGLELGEFQVWRQFSQETGHCVTSKLRLYHANSRRMRGIWHLQYMEWGEQGCPLSVGHFLGFLEELSSVRQHTVSEIPLAHNRNPPVLVHCSAGVGRTGVAILSDLLLFTLDHNQEIDIPRVTALLRQQRMLMVQTVAQYRFVHTLLMYYLKHSRLI